MSLAIGATGCGAINRIHRTNGRRTRGRAARIFSLGARMRARARVRAYHARRDRFSDFRPRDLAIARRPRMEQTYPGAAR